MRLRSFLALSCFLATASLFAGEAPRFSQTLSAEQRISTGIDRLDSNQIAALDALVRLNRNQTAAAELKAERAKTTASAKSTAVNDATPAAETAPAPQPATFSKSLSAEQRHAAGLDTLTAEQLASVDSIVAAHAPDLPNYRPALASNVGAIEFFPNRFEVHGEIGFSFGAGSGGYNSRAAWLNTRLLDTKTGTEISVTVASGREKWKRPYGSRYDWDDYDIGIGIPVLGAP